MKHDRQDEDDYPLETEDPESIPLAVFGFVLVMVGAISQGTVWAQIVLICVGLLLLVKSKIWS